MLRNARDEVLRLVEQGYVPAGGTRRAMEAARALPDAMAWRRFLDQLLLWMGTAMLGAALVFFLAYNWEDLGRYAKLGLAEAAIAVALAIAWRSGLEGAVGKAALLAASIFVGALLALVGQIYQTGADTFELFASWAIAILAWVLIARFAALWLLWLAIVNLAVTLYFDAFRGLFGVLFGTEHQLWLLFALNTLALVALEWGRAAGTAWLRERWSMQIVATASGAFITALAMIAIFDWRWRPVSILAVPAWLLWLALAYAVYRRRIRDLFVLAGGALSVIVVSASFLVKHALGDTAVTFLFVAVVIIFQTAIAGWWLTGIAREEA